MSIHKLGRLHSMEEFIKYHTTTNFKKKVIFLTISDDIRKLSGTNDKVARQLNIDCLDDLFIHYTINGDFDKRIIIPQNIPVLYYGGHQEAAKAFLEKFNIQQTNMYNQPDEMKKSGDKVVFHKLYKDCDWVPKTVFTKEEALNGDVGFPVVAKIKDGHSGIGIEKFDTKEDLEKSDKTFDLYTQFIDFKSEFRCMMLNDRCFMVNERIPFEKTNKTIRTKKADEQVDFMYVYTDDKKIPEDFKAEVQRIADGVQKEIVLGFWSLDLVMDNDGKLWALEINSATGLGAAKLVEAYIQIYEDYFECKLPETFKNEMFIKYVVPAHKLYYPKNKAEIEKALWPMDYDAITKL